MSGIPTQIGDADNALELRSGRIDRHTEKVDVQTAIGDGALEGVVLALIGVDADTSYTGNVTLADFRTGEVGVDGAYSLIIARDLTASRHATVLTLRRADDACLAGRKRIDSRIRLIDGEDRLTNASAGL